MQKPLVSIILPAYNAEEYIYASIDSTLNQSYDNFELLITDDKSTDSTLLKIQAIQDDRIKIFRNHKNKGYLRTFNDLLSRCNGELITSIDADDYYDLTKVEKQVQTFLNDPEIYFCGTNFNRVSESGRIIETSKFPHSYKSIMHHLKSQPDVELSTTTLMIRSEVRDKIGGYREFYLECAGEDYDWFRRIAEQYKGICLTEALYNYRFLNNSLTRKVNFDIKKRHIIEISYFFAQQRKKFGKDDIMTGDYSAYDIYLKNLERPYLNDPSLIYRQVAFESALSNNYSEVFKYIKEAISRKPINFKNYLTLVFIICIRVFPIEILYRLKSKFKFKHISKRL